jgi:hypothetical protein
LAALFDLLAAAFADCELFFTALLAVAPLCLTALLAVAPLCYSFTCSASCVFYGLCGCANWA